ncbi:Replication factor A protein 2 [Spathaspora sp. JA1]|nr:Replication factor A protein 2 [Spathaspora sp. JA1]
MSDFYGNYNDGGFSTTANSQPVSAGVTTAPVRSSLTPVTIKQINDAKQPMLDGPFEVHNVELNMVGFIGVVRKINVFESAISFVIEDGTGSVEVRKWINHDSTTKEAEEEAYTSWVNTYVYVGGALKEFNEKTSIQYPTLYQVTDSNQIVYHHLSAIMNHLRSQGIPTTGKKEPGLFVSEKPASIPDQIYQLLRENSPSMPEGVPLTYICQKLGITPQVAEHHCSDLMESGKVYAGYDDAGYLCV